MRRLIIVLVLLFIELGLSFALVADVQCQSVSFRDSLGIWIAENRTRPREIQLASEPFLEIGTATGDAAVEFSEITAAKRHKDGRIFVLDGGSREIRIFSDQGEHLATVGRRGQGPGELERPFALWLGSDTVVAWDARLQRFTFFPVGGGDVRTVGSPASIMRPWPVSVSFGGPVVLRSDPIPQPSSRAVETFFSQFHVVTPSGRRGPDLPSQLFGKFGVHGQPPRVYQELFSHFLQTTVSLGGFWVGTTYSSEVRRYLLSGQLVQIVRWRPNRKPPGSSDVDEVKAAVRTLAPRHSEEISERPVASAFATHGLLMEDRAGRLWVQDYEWPGDASSWWTVFSGRGRSLGRVRLRQTERLRDAGQGWVMVSAEGAFGAPVVRLYSLDMAPGGEGETEAGGAG